ncbi:MAG: methyltransferase domain-containing protein [Moorea sp. SIO3G5]|nr:methyltransferase domain-containing protein [Moorena sp. SIO3G5]
MNVQTALLYEDIFICPYCNNKKDGLYNLILDSEKLKCPNCSMNYDVVDGVPVLAEDYSITSRDESETFKKNHSNNTIENRANFYSEHYYNRSRTIDLESPYLAQERCLIKNFIKNNCINALCLEVGCGTGIFADVSNRYLGLDYSFSSVFSEGFNNYARIVASAESIPLKSESVNLVFSFNTLEHIPDPELAFSEIDRVLMHNGYAILKPAWHCTKYNTELLPIKPYRELNAVKRCYKFIIPLLKTKLYKFITRIPKRLLRRLYYSVFSSQVPTKLSYRKLNPSLYPCWNSDRLF